MSPLMHWILHPFTSSMSSSLLHHESLHLYWIIPLECKHASVSPLQKTITNNSFDPHIVFQLPPFSFTKELVYASCLHFLTSHSLLHLFHLVSVPTTSLKLFLSKSPMTSMLSNPMDICFYLYSVQPLSSFHLVSPSSLKCPSLSLHSTAFA